MAPHVSGGTPWALSTRELPKVGDWIHGSRLSLRVVDGRFDPANLTWKWQLEGKVTDAREQLHVAFKFSTATLEIDGGSVESAFRGGRVLEFEAFRAEPREISAIVHYDGTSIPVDAGLYRWVWEPPND